MATLAALCKPHSASEQKLSAPIHSTLLDDFAKQHLTLPTNSQLLKPIGSFLT